MSCRCSRHSHEVTRVVPLQNREKLQHFPKGVQLRDTLSVGSNSMQEDKALAGLSGEERAGNLENFGVRVGAGPRSRVGDHAETGGATWGAQRSGRAGASQQEIRGQDVVQGDMNRSREFRAARLKMSCTASKRSNDKNETKERVSLAPRASKTSFPSTSPVWPIVSYLSPQKNLC